MKPNLNLLLIFLAILFFISGCNKNQKHPTYDLTQEDRAWMEPFFTGLMLQNPGIYTLCGSKPMTCITLHYHTDEEIQAYYDQMTEEQKKTAVYVEDYQLAQNWERWEKIRSRFRTNRFMIYKKNDAIDPKFAHVYFVDPLKVADAISKNYKIFKDVAGFDFDPIQEAFQIEKGSAFWNKVQKNPVICGILFGFGVKNSLKFYWEHWGLSENTEDFENYVPCYVSDGLKDGKSTLENLTLPAFMSYFKDDEIIQKYKAEREAIRNEYQGKNFLDYTLQKLTSQ